MAAGGDATGRRMDRCTGASVMLRAYGVRVDYRMRRSCRSVAMSSSADTSSESCSLERCLPRNTVSSQFGLNDTSESDDAVV